MSRYGYLDMPEGYSDVSLEQVTATCSDCGRQITTDQEMCWPEHGNLLTHCGCTETDDASLAWCRVVSFIDSSIYTA